LEGLEDRFCPSSLTLNDSLVQQGVFKFSGQYSGGTRLGGQTVTIAGQGWKTTATTDPSGYYSATIGVSQLGTVTAQVTPDPPATAQVTLSYPPPDIIDFCSIRQNPLQVEFKGQVTGTPDPGMMIIDFAGVSAISGKTCKVSSNGTFDVVFTIQNQTGTVSAYTTDWWGQASNTALTAV
jgi:hypothetical protein